MLKSLIKNTDFIALITIILLFVINPLLGDKFNDLSNIYLRLAPLALIGSAGFYLTQKKLESNSILSFTIAAITSFCVGIFCLQYVQDIYALIIVFYIQVVFYYTVLIYIKK